MFVHEVYTSDGFVGMKHSREIATPSGLVIPTELARSAVDYEVRRYLTDRARRGLAVAPIEHELGERFDDRIECDDIDDFTRQGVDAWKTALRDLQSYATGITVIFAERQPDTPPFSGLIMPDVMIEEARRKQEFLGFIAAPREMEALESMRDQVTDYLQQPAERGVGGYA